ncbi:unnamed protein product [Protopolystoma xenopodis]|uniref:Uncharacterized protein n=1 Tax=Protopolystoma xenopodis TaxID=117903 RepID=A0A448WJU9_9PLAT|nr:unnamed protein product [Protopolystoma xenopodis]
MAPNSFVSTLLYCPSLCPLVNVYSFSEFYSALTQNPLLHLPSHSANEMVEVESDEASAPNELQETEQKTQSMRCSTGGRKKGFVGIGERSRSYIEVNRLGRLPPRWLTPMRERQSYLAHQAMAVLREGLRRR